MTKLKVKNNLKSGLSFNFLSDEILSYDYVSALGLDSDIKEIKLINASISSTESIEDRVVIDAGSYFDSSYGNYLPKEKCYDVYCPGEAIVLCLIEIVLENGVELEVEFIQPFQYDDYDEKQFETESEVDVFYECLLEESYVF